MSGLSLMPVGSMVNTKEATAEAGDVLNGKTFFAGDYHIKTGTMPNKGAWNDSVAMNGSVTIPAGYHNGSGKIAANSCKVRVLEATASDSGYHGPNHSASASVNIGGLGTIVGVYAGIGGSSIYDQNMSGGKHNSSISVSGVSISGSTAYATVTWWRSFYGGEYWQCNATVKFFVFYY